MKFIFAYILLCFHLTSFGQTKSKSLDTSIWKLGNENLQFLDSTISNVGEVGYIDTFSFYGNYFRLIHHDTLYDGILEKYTNGHWEKNIQFEHLGGHNDYYRNKDVNNDNYNDLILEWKWDTEVFLYDPKLKRFTEYSFRHPRDWILLDKKHNIFCDYFDFKFAKQNTSKLYTFKGDKMTVLSSVEFFQDKDDNSKIKKIILYKNKTKVEELKINDYEFDYEKFWKKRYKKILGYS